MRGGHLISNMKPWVASILACACCAASLPASAALGGSVDSVKADESQMKAARRVAGRAGYEVHEMTLPTGTVVREFVGNAGTVFAVAWQGPLQPDLNALLGAYFPRFVAAGQVAHGGHRRLEVRAADLVIDSGGKMRAFAGRAYLPALVPANVAIEEIR